MKFSVITSAEQTPSASSVVKLNTQPGIQLILNFN